LHALNLNFLRNRLNRTFYEFIKAGSSIGRNLVFHKSFIINIESTAETHFIEKWHFQTIDFIWFKFATIVDFGFFAGQSRLTSVLVMAAKILLIAAASSALNFLITNVSTAKLNRVFYEFIFLNNQINRS